MTHQKLPLFPTMGAKIAAVVCVLSALALGAALGIVLHPKDTNTTITKADKVVLEPITKVAQDAWVTTGVDLTTDPAAVGAQYGQFTPSGDVPDDRATQTYATLAGRTVNGDSPGIYAGQRDTQVCDKAALRSFFTTPANADAALAWATSLGLDVGQIGNYIDGLTGARLRWDTRVTDAGLRNGTVVTWQALLQAGTAVLVDNTGVPRVKCNSGSPLLSPQGLRHTTTADLTVADVAENPADAWSGLNARDAVTVQPGRDALQTVTLVDVDNSDLLQRGIGSDGISSRDVGTGDVQFNLKYASPVDLDIHVVDPNGYSYGYQDTYYAGGTSTSPDDGHHDVDFLCNNTLDGNGFAQENVFWPNHDAPSGTYSVFIRAYNTSCSSGAPRRVPFTLTVTINGSSTQYSGVVTSTDPAQQDSQTWRFTKN